MFNNINAEMGRKGWGVKELAKKSDIKYGSLLNKLNERTCFTREEMKRVHNCFPYATIEYLFYDDKEEI